MFSVECVRTLRMIVKCEKINSIIFSFLRTDHLFCVKPVKYYCPNVNRQTDRQDQSLNIGLLQPRYSQMLLDF